VSRTVVVTGVGAVTPLGVGARTLHERWTAGVSGIAGGEAACDEFDPTAVLSRKEAKRADRFTQLAIAAAAEAVADAWGDDGVPYEPERVGVIVGTGIGGMQTFEDQCGALIEGGPSRVTPLSVPLLMGNAGSAAVSMRHGLRGPSYSVASACAAGAHAIGDAVTMIRAGQADAVVAGGSEATLTPLARASFAALDATSTVGESHPFDARRDGFVMGEGSGLLVLEDAEAAAARGARVLATIRGYGATSDAHHLTAPPADGEGAARAIGIALRDAGLTPADVDYVNAHGTSTPLNDRAETIAIKAALGERAYAIPVSSLKSAIGHTLGASGAIEAVATVLALRDRVAPPTLGWAERDEGLDLDYVAEGTRTLTVPADRLPVAISNSFGFGGHNAVLVLEAA
jgi:3-oxoacyl-[acyl-carrier-protein] synthase II